ncbi:helix-turn-helix domain-containing protein [Ornithinibacillus sp. L9]|uniref:Helix-turn-helix domain-containing protein n=1 Tax=Ornithinibacillus caprae TaxID=2678566 RepID=A0A6N8FDH0_9BACI|nr:IclR family transcriptional regulator [Ornithinibacillus caprae]MUK87560.1 helix-turn-helix domain-containing protein [Ornithinibacillus caprae]
MSKQKYWVPALEKANLILEQIAKHPKELRLIDLSNKLEINKSSMYSLLNTLESLGWIHKEKSETYSLGSVLGFIGSNYLNQFNILEAFSREAKKAIEIVDEHIQLGKLIGNEVFYIGREQGSSPVRLVTDPGTRYPSYASAIGKIQLINFNYDELRGIFPNYYFEQKTEHTVKNVDQLWEQVQKAKIDGYVVEEQEGADGFYCVAAPIYDHSNKVVYGVSFTMTETSWLKKKKIAKEEITKLAHKLSEGNGYVGYS